ncbi:MAG TPA: substrate-binding domain-containing protein [Nocardioidaceae bacterium]|nr:substrate-binding domain-containing protein [Nocardioidaceae bacterium]
MALLQQRVTHRGGVVLAAVAASALILAGCSSSPGTKVSDKSASTSNYKMVFVPKSLGNKYFQASDAGGKAAIQEFGGTYSEASGTQASATSQSPYIQTAIQHGVGSIVLAANDPQAVCNDLQQAQSAGIKVVTFDSDTNCRDIFVNQVTVQAVADGLVKLLVDHLGSAGGKIGIESGGPNATNLNAWIDAIKKDLKKYPNIKIVDEVYGNDDDQDSYNAARGLIQANPDMQAIIAPDSVASKEAAHFLSDHPQYQGKIWLTGLGLPSELRDYVHSGVVEKFGVWNVNDLGYLAAYAAKALIDGKITGKQGDKFTAGKLGTYTVAANGEVDLGPLLVIDKSNVDKYNF